VKVKIGALAFSAVVACATLGAGLLAPAGAAVQAEHAAKGSFEEPYSWHSETVKGAPASAAGWDPINVVIVPGDRQPSAAADNDDILTALRKEKGVYWDEVGIGTNFLIGNCISGQDADVQHGREQAVSQNFSWRTVTCHSPKLLEEDAITNHVRVYVQHATGAWFLAVSEEHFCKIKNGNGTKAWHCITENGYDQGRDALVAELKKLPGYDVSVRWEQEYAQGAVPEHPLGYHTPYDGRVAVVTITPKKVLLPYQSTGWRYRQVASNGDSGFQEPSYNVSKWAVGQAGFGTTGGTCPWNNTTDVHTPWDADTDMLVRHWLTIPADATKVHIAGTIDNNAHVYVNGHLVQYTQSGYCDAGAIDVTVPASDLKPHTLLAIRGTDLGDETYLDVTVTGDIS
jgi:hypothetical protein